MLIVMDSFATYHNWDGGQIPSAGGGKWSVRNGGGVGSSAGGVPPRFTGSFAMAFANGACLGKHLDTPRDELILGGGYSTSNNGVVVALHQFFDGATIQATITAEIDNSIALRRGDIGGTIVAQTAAGVYTRVTIWSGLSYRVKIHPSAGEFQVWKDGSSILNVSGLNTRSSGTSQITDFYLAASGSSNPGFYMVVSDFYCFDTTGSKNNAFPGDVRIRTLRPNADTVTKDWTIIGGTAGSHFYRVATPNVLDDSYAGGEYSVRSNVVGQVDRWDTENLPSITGPIPAVALTYRAYKNDAGVRQMSGGIQSGGVDADGATRSLGTSFFNYYDQFELDPNGSIDWVPTAVNGVKIHVKMVA